MSDKIIEDFSKQVNSIRETADNDMKTVSLYTMAMKINGMLPEELKQSDDCIRRKLSRYIDTIFKVFSVNDDKEKHIDGAFQIPVKYIDLICDLFKDKMTYTKILQKCLVNKTYEAELFVFITTYYKINYNADMMDKVFSDTRSKLAEMEETVFRMKLAFNDTNSLYFLTIGNITDRLNYCVDVYAKLIYIDNSKEYEILCHELYKTIQMMKHTFRLMKCMERYERDISQYK